MNFGAALERRMTKTGGKMIGLSAMVAAGRADDTEEVTDLGVALEGVRVEMGEAGNLRVGLGAPSHFHRDELYDPQTYLRARKIKKGAGRAQGENNLKPGRL
ncbi:MAG: hypothetical protein ACLFWF_01065 [Alphaproteobacteria bacterium]